MQDHCAVQWRNVRGALTLAGLMWVAAAIDPPPAQAQTYTVLHRFTGGVSNGENPAAGLWLNATTGDVYGTTVLGPGCNPTACAPDPGMVFQLDTTTGTETVLYSFKGKPDGASPFAGLVQDSAGNLYGTTSAGGTSNLGTVFKLANTVETVLHSFTGPPADGASPYAGLVGDSDGNFYGTTSAGGASNKGVVFKVTATGAEKVLYSFAGGADGGFPYGGLLRTSAGDVYGTTSAGGIMTGNCYPNGCGVVFEVNTAGKETVLYSFTGSPDGASPYAGLIGDTDDNLYGTTYNGGTGGCTNGCGAVFKLNSAGVETVLHSFAGYPTDGAFPDAGLVRDSTGNLYGTAAYGGGSDNGVVFELGTTGTETLLYSFPETTDGAVPLAGLVLNSADILYGTTYGGGVTGAPCGGEPADTCGVVFKLKP